MKKCFTCTHRKPGAQYLSSSVSASSSNMTSTIYIVVYIDPKVSPPAGAASPEPLRTTFAGETASEDSSNFLKSIVEQGMSVITSYQTTATPSNSESFSARPLVDSNSIGTSTANDPVTSSSAMSMSETITKTATVNATDSMMSSPTPQAATSSLSAPIGSRGNNVSQGVLAGTAVGCLLAGAGAALLLAWAFLGCRESVVDPLMLPFIVPPRAHLTKNTSMCRLSQLVVAKQINPQRVGMKVHKPQRHCPKTHHQPSLYPTKRSGYPVCPLILSSKS